MSFGAEELLMSVRLFSINETKEQISQAYVPVVLAGVDDFVIRLVKFQGEFERWHAHENEDEAFVVLEGEVSFQTEDGDHILKAGERDCHTEGHESLSEDKWDWSDAACAGDRKSGNETPWRFETARRDG